MIDPPKRKRRWLQFSLRSLLIFTLICAIPCAWLGRRFERKREEQAAVAVLRSQGAEVIYDYGMGEPAGPSWLRSFVGETFFNEVIVVNMFGDNVTDDVFTNVKGLTKLQSLFMPCTNVSDRGLVNLKELTQLTYLRAYPITEHIAIGIPTAI